jgi:hypothetical protein
MFTNRQRNQREIRVLIWNNYTKIDPNRLGRNVRAGYTWHAKGSIGWHL